MAYYGTQGDDYISADSIQSSSPILEAYGLEGDDTIVGSFQYDADDKLSGGLGDDWFNGNGGNDQINGGDGNDFAIGGSGNDYLFGGSGNDDLYANSGDDNLYGGSGNDLMFGNDGNDYMIGGSGEDLVYGQAGEDRIFTGSGDDTLLGGSGNDNLDGDQGDDILTGGAGADVFEFDYQIDQGNNVITDFDIGTDQIDLGPGANDPGDLYYINGGGSSELYDGLYMTFGFDDYQGSVTFENLSFSDIVNIAEDTDSGNESFSGFDWVA